MSSATLVIFVDAYPFGESESLSKAIGSKTRVKVTPGVGYSINVKTELFAGLDPDGVGYFCEWNYQKERVHRWLNQPVVTALKVFGSLSNFANRVVHRLVKEILGSPVYAIPFDVLPYLEYSGPVAYEHAFAKPTFLSEGGFARVLYSEHGGKDEAVFRAARRVLKNERPKKLFVATAELDCVMHRYGMSCAEYRDHLEAIDQSITDLVSEFIDMHGSDAETFIFSDHGMAPVTESVRFDIQGVLGPPGPSSYGYFVDATFLRVWLNNPEQESNLRQALAELGNGHVLTEDERSLYGLKKRSHGDIIFLLDEGKMFAPSFFGDVICKAMHGYNPELESQQGIFLSNTRCWDQERIKAREVHKVISSLL